MIKKVLITGGTGFIGFWLAGWMPFDVTVLDHRFYYNYDWIDAYWDYIIHLAPVPADKVIECAQKCNAAVLFASSGGVYDRYPDDYFKMKLADEIKLLAAGLDVKIARIFTTCGAHMKWNRYAIGNFIKQAAAGEPIVVQSYGLVVRSYMYGSDLADWLWKILLEGKPGTIYNVGSDVPHSTAELAHEIARHFEPCPAVILEKKLQFEPRPYYVSDVARAREELGLSIKVSFEEAVAKTVEDYKNE